MRPDKNGAWLPAPDGYHQVALGNCTQWPIEIARISDRIFVAVRGASGTAKICSFTHAPKWEQVQRMFGKSRVRYEGDARHLADFIASQLGTPHQIQGDYTRHPDLMRSAAPEYGQDLDPTPGGRFPYWEPARLLWSHDVPAKKNERSLAWGKQRDDGTRAMRITMPAQVRDTITVMQDTFRAQWRAQGRTAPVSRPRLTIRFRVWRNGWDSDNALTTILDALQGADVLLNDNTNHLRDYRVIVEDATGPKAPGRNLQAVEILVDGGTPQ